MSKTLTPEQRAALRDECDRAVAGALTLPVRHVAALLDAADERDLLARLAAETHRHLCDAIGLPRHTAPGVAINHARLLAHGAKVADAAREDRDKAIADRTHLADGLAHALGMDAGHPMPMSMLASVRIIVAAADAVREERDRLAADLDAVRENARALVDAFEDRGPPQCYHCGAIATQWGRNDDMPVETLDRCDDCTVDLRRPEDFSYAPAWRRLVAMVRPPELDPGPAPGTAAWFDQARADLAAEGTPVDAADWLIGPDED